MSLNKKQMLKVASFIGKNLMKEIKLKKEFTDTWIQENKDKLGKGATIDTETTGICPLEDEITELAIRPFLYNKETLEIVRVLEAFDEFQEPSSMDKLTQEIQDLTGITPDMVRGMSINWATVNQICDSCDFLIAHNADFDKTMLTVSGKYESQTKWVCSFLEVDWFAHGLPNRKQEILGPSLCLIDESLAFDFVAHRAINDVDALLQLIVNLELLPEMLIPTVEVRVNGYVSKDFYELYWKRNRCYFKSDKLKDQDGKWVKDSNGKFIDDKFCTIKMKENKVQSFIDKSNEKAKRINANSILDWKILPV